jgi:hypothetical protein
MGRRRRAHDCWTTTEAALTADLSSDLRDAWERLRETAAEFGEQRIYASHHCIMFSRKACYFFVRPKRSALEVVFFLGRLQQAPQIRRTDRSSLTKIAHIVHIQHRDQVEAPITDWLQEAYDVSEVLSARGGARTTAAMTGASKPATKSTRKPVKRQTVRKEAARKRLATKRATGKPRAAKRRTS